MSRPKKSIQEKVQEQFPEFFDSVASLSSVELDQRLAELAKDNEKVLDSKDADEALQEAREQAKVLNAPYNDSLKAVRLKSKYIISLLKG